LMNSSPKHTIDTLEPLRPSNLLVTFNVEVLSY